MESMQIKNEQKLWDIFLTKPHNCVTSCSKMPPLTARPDCREVVRFPKNVMTDVLQDTGAEKKMVTRVVYSPSPINHRFRVYI